MKWWKCKETLAHTHSQWWGGNWRNGHGGKWKGNREFVVDQLVLNLRVSQEIKPSLSYLTVGFTYI